MIGASAIPKDSHSTCQILRLDLNNEKLNLSAASESNQNPTIRVEIHLQNLCSTLLDEHDRTLSQANSPALPPTGRCGTVVGGWFNSRKQQTVFSLPHLSRTYYKHPRIFMSWKSFSITAHRIRHKTVGHLYSCEKYNTNSKNDCE